MKKKDIWNIKLRIISFYWLIIAGIYTTEKEGAREREGEWARESEGETKWEFARKKERVGEGDKLLVVSTCSFK